MPSKIMSKIFIFMHKFLQKFWSIYAVLIPITIWKVYLPYPCVLSHFSPVQLFVTLWTVVCQTPLSMDSTSKNTGVGLHALLQGIFPDQGLNLLSWGSCIAGRLLLSYRGLLSLAYSFIQLYSLTLIPLCIYMCVDQHRPPNTVLCFHLTRVCHLRPNSIITFSKFSLTALHR